MDYFKKINEVLKEVFLFKQFKRMNVLVNIFLLILLSPLYVAALCISAAYYVYVIFYKLISMPSDILKNFYKNEGSDVHFLTQSIVYLICLPFVFFLQVILSFLSLTIGILYFILINILQVATLNGIEYKPFILDERLNEEVNLEKIPLINRLFLVITLYFLVLLVLVFADLTDYLWLAAIFGVMFIGLLILYPIFIFKKNEESKEINKPTAIITMIVLGIIIIIGCILNVAEVIKYNTPVVEGEIQVTSDSNANVYINIKEDAQYVLEFDENVDGMINGVFFSGKSVTVFLNAGEIQCQIFSVNGNSEYNGKVKMEVYYQK